MKFKLMQKSAGRASASGLTTFTVTDEKNVVRGTVSVPSAESDDLVRCWKGEYKPATKTGPNEMAKVLMEKRTKVSKAALLRS
jgi:hypothetical protein